MDNLNVRTPPYNSNVMEYNNEQVLSPLKPAPTDHFPDFIKENPQYLSPDNAMGFISDDDGDSYNYCHCEYA